MIINIVRGERVNGRELGREIVWEKGGKNWIEIIDVSGDIFKKK